MCLEGSFNPLSFHPAYAPLSRAPTRPNGCSRSGRPGATRRVLHGAGRGRRALPDARARPARQVSGPSTDGDIDYEPPADASIAAVAAATGQSADRSRDRPADRRRRQRDHPHPVLQLRLRRPVVHLRGTPASRHPDGSRRRRRPLRGGLRRGHADVHAHPLDPRPHPRSEAPARARRAPPDPRDRRALRPRRPRRRAARACAPT